MLCGFKICCLDLKIMLFQPYIMLLDLKYAARLYIICCPALKRCCVALKLRYYDLYYLACHLRNFYIHLFRLADLLTDWLSYEQLHPSRLLVGVGSGQATTTQY